MVKIKRIAGFNCYAQCEIRFMIEIDNGD